MKKLFALALACAMTLSLVSCGSSSSTPSGSGTSSDAARTQLIVGFDAEYPPYGYMDDSGNYVGFDLDLAAEVCDRNSWELVLQPIDWNSKDMELSSGAIDCIWSGFTIQGREDDYAWTDPYVDNSIVIVVRSDSGIETMDGLAGKIVCTQADSSALSALTSEDDNEKNLALAATFKELQQVADYNTAFMDLESGMVDAIAVDIGVAQYQIASRGDKFKQLDDPISTEQYGVGFRLTDTDLRDTVNSTLLDMAKDGTVDKIAANYADYNLPEMVCLGK